MDPRSLRSREALRRAALDLAAVRPLTDLSVSEICRAASRPSSIAALSETAVLTSCPGRSQTIVRPSGSAGQMRAESAGLLTWMTFTRAARCGVTTGSPMVARVTSVSTWT